MTGKRIADDEKVWFETRRPRWSWQWWGWKKVDKSLVDMNRVHNFITFSAAPHVMMGIEFRIRKPWHVFGNRMA